jgi:hypothetical protein
MQGRRRRRMRQLTRNTRHCMQGKRKTHLPMHDTRYRMQRRMMRRMCLPMPDTGIHDA